MNSVSIFGTLLAPSTRINCSIGDLVYITVAGQGMLVMNSHKVAADLLDRRAAIYSDRPRLIGDYLFNCLQLQLHSTK